MLMVAVFIYFEINTFFTEDISRNRWEDGELEEKVKERKKKDKWSFWLGDGGSKEAIVQTTYLLYNNGHVKHAEQNINVSSGRKKRVKLPLLYCCLKIVFFKH